MTTYKKTKKCRTRSWHPFTPSDLYNNSGSINYTCKLEEQEKNRTVLWSVTRESSDGALGQGAVSGWYVLKWTMTNLISFLLLEHSLTSCVVPSAFSSLNSHVMAKRQFLKDSCVSTSASLYFWKTWSAQSWCLCDHVLFDPFFNIL